MKFEILKIDFIISLKLHLTFELLSLQVKYIVIWFFFNTLLKNSILELFNFRKYILSSLHFSEAYHVSKITFLKKFNKSSKVFYLSSISYQVYWSKLLMLACAKTDWTFKNWNNLQLRNITNTEKLKSFQSFNCFWVKLFVF